MNFKKWVKSTQTAGYNGTRTVSQFIQAENWIDFFQRKWDFFK